MIPRTAIARQESLRLLDEALSWGAHALADHIIGKLLSDTASNSSGSWVAATTSSRRPPVNSVSRRGCLA